VSEERSAHIINVTIIGEAGGMLAVKKGDFWDVPPCGSEPHGEKSQKTPFFTANIPPASQIIVTLMMWALRSSETSVLTRATRRHIPEDGILNSHRHGNLKSYITLTVWPL
jgi:hypothetical protein